MNARMILLSTVAMGLALQALPARAQQEEIIVFARKREESILKVPVVETVISQEQLEKYGANDIYAISQRVPGFVIGTGTAMYGAQVSVRGVGTSALNPALDQSVSLVIDGQPFSQGLAYQAGMFDLGQAEVLKGPQSLFYGKNSPGGVIALRSADPTDKAEIILRGGYEFEAGEKVGEIILSGPITPALKGRLAAHFSDMDGYFENKAFAPPVLNFGGVTPKYRDFAPREDWLVRGTLLFEPGDVYDARLKVNYTKKEVEGDGGEGQLGFCPDGIVSPVPGLQFVNPNDTCTIDRDVYLVDMDPAAFPGIRGGGVRYHDTWQAFGSLEQNLHLPHSLTLTSVTGLYTTQHTGMISGNAPGYAAPMAAIMTDFYRRDFTQEFRLTSDFANSPVNFMAGGFYQDASMAHRASLPTNRLLFPPFLGRLADAKLTVGTHSVSAFGQVIWKVVPELEVAAGARWTHEARKLRQYNFNPPFPPSLTLPLGATTFVAPRIASDNLSPEVSVTYTPTDDLTFFGSYKQAFKSGSFNAVSAQPAGSDPSFGDEKVRGGEIGLKSRWLGRSLTVNLAAYRYHYSDLQVGASVINPTTGAIEIRTVNAASANIHGVELETSYSPPAIEGLTLHAAANYNHARYGTFNTAQCGNGQTIGQGCNRSFDPTPSASYPAGHFTAQDLSNRPLVRAPDWTANFGFDYAMPVGGEMKLTIGSATTYSSRYYTNLLDQPGYFQKAFFKTDATIALSGPNDAWEIAFIGNNLGDELTTGSCVNGGMQSGVFVSGMLLQGLAAPGPGGQDEGFCNVDRGREMWIRLTVRPLDLFGK